MERVSEFSAIRQTYNLKRATALDISSYCLPRFYLKDSTI